MVRPPRGGADGSVAPDAGISHAGDGAAAVSGADVIRNHLAGLGNGPGVYRMLDGRGGALYIGKARNLKRRVAAYTKPRGHQTRIQRMIAATASMEFTTTATEAEALLLESILIKRLKPRYNILLRDDKAFPQILIRGGHAFPQLMKHRGARQPEGRYFGPFASAGAVNRTLNQLQKAFLLRTCSDSTFANRSRPCLLHQIRRCSGPCAGLVSDAEYSRQVDDATRFLRGQSTAVQEGLAKRMQAASDELDFERAALFRDRIRALTAVQARQGVNPQTVREADLFALHLESGQGCTQAVFYRAQQHWGDRAYFPRFAAEDGAAGHSRSADRAVLREPHAAAGYSPVARGGADGSAGIGSLRQTRQPSPVARAEAGREASPHGAGPGERPGSAGAENGGSVGAGRPAGEPCGGFPAGRRAGPDRSVRQLPHSGLFSRGSDDRGGTGRLSEVPVPEVQSGRG